MKTITLTDEAYERLKEWKDGTHDSFSNVVLRIVPKRGTLADLLENFKRLPPLKTKDAEAMETAINWANDWQNQPDPWMDEATVNRP